MPRKGRPPAWTPAEREQVLALAQEGMSQRAIAEQVFGDGRYRGRVERILREEAIGRRELPELPDAPEEIDEAFDAGDVSVARMIVARYERSLAESADDKTRAWWLERLTDREIAEAAEAMFGEADRRHIAAERARLLAG